MARTVRVLLVEDSDNDVILIERELNKSKDFEVKVTAVSAIKDVIHALTHETWDIVIADYNLIGYDAHKVVAILEDLGLSIPLILLSGRVDDKVADELIRAGAHDYVDKKAVVRLHPVMKRELALSEAHDETLKAWVKALDLRDRETAGHSDRVVDLSVRLARSMSVTESDIAHIKRGALLHDIGKMGIPDAILHKKGKLTDEEMDAMKLHPELGYDLLKNISFLKRSVDIPHYHHEKWDGSGYPYGLEGDDIPIAARIFAVVDVYDAMTSNRPYREALTKKIVLDSIKNQSGSHFDPKVVDAFLTMIEKEEDNDSTD